MPTLLVIVASVRPTRVGGAVAAWVLEHARARSGWDVKVADLRELALPVMDEPNHPRLREYQFEHTKRWSAIVEDADGFLFVSPEYNHSIPGALKNAIDYLLLEWSGKPFGLATYGGVSAGTRSAVALQAVFMGLAMRGTRANVEIPWVAQRIDGNGAFTSDERLDAVLEAQLDELSHQLSARDA
ncbi:NAD(P)H-dependent oxidoreductase [Gryllotalpicola koreensis]|uniref:NAD(P)H-dependent oxidoreductase n=1 Tax=Gryllotalpicola koreensis TaxID=993086 RepID=A0ABP8A7V9_9MICO